MASGSNVRPHVRNFKIDLYTDQPDLLSIVDYHSLIAHPRFQPTLPYDPSTLSNLVGDYRAPDDIYCAFGHPHKAGFVAELADGTVSIIGNSCAESHFDMNEYRLLKNSLSNRQAREHLRQTLEKLDELKTALEEHANRDNPLSASSMFRTMKQLREALPEEAQAQLFRMRRDRTNKLIVIRSADGPEHDLRLLLDTKRRNRGLWEEEVGTLRGAESLSSWFDVNLLIRNTRFEIAKLKGETDLDSRQVRRYINIALSDVTKNLTRLEQARSHLRRFLAPKNLEQLSLVVKGGRARKDLKRAIRRHSVRNLQSAA